MGDGVAEDHAVGSIPEDHGVEEAFGIGVGELELPVLASVGGVVDAGLIAGTGGHEEGLVGGEGYDRAEIQSGGVRDLGGEPGVAGIGGAEVGAVRAGSPCDVMRDGAYAAEIFGGVGGMSFRSGLGQGGGGSQENQQSAHGGLSQKMGAVEKIVELRSTDSRARLSPHRHLHMGTSSYLAMKGAKEAALPK